MKNYGFGEKQVRQFKGFPLSECVENVSLESVEYASGENYEAIDFNFTRPGGERLRDRMFEVNEENVKIQGDLSLEDSIKRAYVQFNTRLWHVADAYGIDREELKDACTGVKNFKAFAAAYAKMISEGCAGKVVFVKTIKAKGGFINLPMFPNFIQSSDEDCSLQWSDYEKKHNIKNAQPVEKVEKAAESAESGETAESGGGLDDDDWLEEDDL